MGSKKRRIFSADFETTVYEGQEFTEVWAAAMVEFGSEEVSIHHSIDDWWKEVEELAKKDNLIIYFHNLKFDGSFILPFLMKGKLEQAYQKRKGSMYEGEFLKTKQMFNNTFKYVISDRGQWYSIIVKLNKHTVEIRDSVKLLPFSVEEIGKGFQTKHKKLSMEYKGFRYAGCEITDAEKEYIANDVLVVKEALEFMYAEGHSKLTIGSCCLSEFKAGIGRWDYERFFPDLSEYYYNKEAGTYYRAPYSRIAKEGHINADRYIRRSYKGGWCYLREDRANKVYNEGMTLDVNSLYPSEMWDHPYPIGLPIFWNGNFIPETAEREDRYFFVRIRTRFYLKKDHLPFIQIKGDWKYKGNECLKTSDVYDRKTKKYYSEYIDTDGNRVPAVVELTLTQTDYKLFLEHYDVEDFEILDGCYFRTMEGIFQPYIEKYKRMKQTSKGARRQLAKLFLNNLYGKMASNKDSSFKYMFLDEDGKLEAIDIDASDKEAGYIAIGSAITSYAREFTIRAAQKNYQYFIYADTDSLHLCTSDISKVVGVPLHATEFSRWKCEALWDEAIFVRQKTYIEHVIAEDLEPIEEPYYNVKCAGLPEKCKKLLKMSINQDCTDEDLEGLSDICRDFVKIPRTIQDFKVGLRIPGCLKAKRIEGGTILLDNIYEMR